VNLLVILLIINIIAFLLFGIDKRKAVRHRYRIPEWVLMLSAFAGGSIGALAGMLLFHHKTKHAKFFIGVPLFLILHLVLVLYYWQLFLELL